MWDHPEVLKEWNKSGERKGKVRFSNDEKRRPYLSRVEIKVCISSERTFTSLSLRM